MSCSEKVEKENNLKGISVIYILIHAKLILNVCLNIQKFHIEKSGLSISPGAHKTSQLREKRSAEPNEKKKRNKQDSQRLKKSNLRRRIEKRKGNNKAKKRNWKKKQMGKKANKNSANNNRRKKNQRKVSKRRKNFKKSKRGSKSKANSKRKGKKGISKSNQSTRNQLTTSSS